MITLMLIVSAIAWIFMVWSISRKESLRDSMRVATIAVSGALLINLAMQWLIEIAILYEWR